MQSTDLGSQRVEAGVTVSAGDMFQSFAAVEDWRQLPILIKSKTGHIKGVSMVRIMTGRDEQTQEARHAIILTAMSETQALTIEGFVKQLQAAKLPISTPVFVTENLEPEAKIQPVDHLRMSVRNGRSTALMVCTFPYVAANPPTLM